MIAEYWHNDGADIVCDLCPHSCRLRAGQSGLCGVRKHAGGDLLTLNYGQLSALALDPIEKKPLKNFHPGSLILSMGSWGCNLACRFCQNWQIAQQRPTVRKMTPAELVQSALAAQKDGNIGLAYTYAEPLVCYEFIKECAVLCHDAGLQNVLVSNGYINKEPLLSLAPCLDAANIDLKAFNGSFYQNMCGGSLEPVKESIKLLAGFCHVEITTLVIPGENDSVEEISALAAWLAGIDRSLPLHLSRYFPCYKLAVAATQREKIYELKKVAENFLTNVYTGNL